MLQLRARQSVMHPTAEADNHSASKTLPRDLRRHRPCPVEDRHMAVNASRGFSLLEMMFVVLIAMTVTAIAIPMSGNILGYFRLSGDARAVSNAVAVTKMRAASDFTRARLYFD